MKSYINPFKNKSNIKITSHKCIEYDISKFSNSEKAIINKLEDNNIYETFIKDVDTNRNKSIKITLSPNESRFIKNLIDNKFYIHHTWKNNIILYKWIDSGSTNKIPSFPFTNIGIGCCIFSNSNKFLLVQERNNHLNDKVSKEYEKNNISTIQTYHNPWKFVTGHIELKETIKDASFREINEELSIQYNNMEFIGNLYMRHLNLDRIVDYCFFNMIYIKNDIKESDLVYADEEIYNARLFSYDEINEMLNLNDKQMTTATRLVLKRVMKYINPNESSISNMDRLRVLINSIVDEDVDDKYVFGMTSLRI